jgi:hypothetical protein
MVATYEVISLRSHGILISPAFSVWLKLQTEDNVVLILIMENRKELALPTTVLQSSWSQPVPEPSFEQVSLFSFKSIFLVFRIKKPGVVRFRYLNDEAESESHSESTQENVCECVLERA